MSVSGEMIIGSISRRGEGGAFRAFDPYSRTEIAPDFNASTLADVKEVCALASEAFPIYKTTTLSERALFLETIAQNIIDQSEEIVSRAKLETGLPLTRLEGELGRTTQQLFMFARVLRDGAFLDIRIDFALPERIPPRPDIRLIHQPVGPVAVFSASNFPLAFSVAGGDTASALAAGCPVIVKAHSAHPGTSEIVGRAIQKAVEKSKFPEGVFSLLFDNGTQIGTALVSDPRIKAVGFTGSRQGGTALMAVAQARHQPISVYAEMSSVNPVVLLPAALEERGETIGKSFASALTLGAGQFCTNPGLLLAIDGVGIENFISGMQMALNEINPGTMLTAGIHKAYCTGVEMLSSHPHVVQIAEGKVGEGLVSKASVFSTSAQDFLSDPHLSEEVFGASSLLVRCIDENELCAVIDALEGQLTASIHATDPDLDLAHRLFAKLECRAGRVLFNGFGTGVEVCDAMVHGGPYPATSDSRSTSVGTLAIMRFLRPVSYQDVPSSLLPIALRDDNPFGVPRRINGIRE